MKEHRIEVDTAKCIGCGMCRRDCPASNISITNKKAVIESQACIKCGHCVAVCPKAAVSMTGFDEPPMEIKKPTVLDPQQLLDAIRTRRTIRQFKKSAGCSRSDCTDYRGRALDAKRGKCTGCILYRVKGPHRAL